MKLPTLLLLSLAACDSQVDGTHQGTPLAELTGNVENRRTAPTNDAEVAILWVNSSGSPDIVAAETAAVEGNFPAAFQLSIYEPPIDALINDYQDSRMGVAYIVSGEAGADYSDEEGILGMDTQHLLVYLPEDIAPGTTVATVLRGTPAAGFHVYDVGHLSDAESDARRACESGLGDTYTIEQLFDTCGGFPSFDDFLPAPANLDTPLEVEIVDDISELDIPNWT
jgi:hypothetical protein